MACGTGHGGRREIATALFEQTNLIAMDVWLIADVDWIWAEILIQRLTGLIREYWSYFGSFGAVMAKCALVDLAIAREPCRIEDGFIG